MAFMEPEVFLGEYYAVDADHGSTWIVPVDVSGLVETWAGLADYVEGDVDDPDGPAVVQTGWLARLSAPGYLDCTDWSVHATETEAREHLAEMYDACPDCGGDINDCEHTIA